jgi:hypothetical protein
MRQRLTAEFLGTFALVFAGTGAVVVNDVTGAVTHVGIALTFGLIVLSLIYALASTPQSRLASSSLAVSRGERRGRTSWFSASALSRRAAASG